MKVIAEEPWNWFLFADGATLYLDVLIEHGAISFSATAALTNEQATAYGRDGAASLSLVAGEMRHLALMGEWRIVPLPEGWAERSIGAVHAWRRSRAGESSDQATGLPTSIRSD